MSDRQQFDAPSDPEADGLPATADDDSSAGSAADSARWADGRDPASLPGDQPLGVDEWGTTPAEERQGEPMDLRLSREQPDVTALRSASEPLPPLSADSAADDDEPRLGPDGELVGRSNDPLLDAVLAGEIQPDDSAVTTYDSLDEQPGSHRVGRLVAPDEGAHADEESDEIAYDAGRSEGGLTAEEAAMHEDPSS